jgi:hypothetical protein
MYHSVVRDGNAYATYFKNRARSLHSWAFALSVITSNLVARQQCSEAFCVTACESGILHGNDHFQNYWKHVVLPPENTSHVFGIQVLPRFFLPGAIMPEGDQGIEISRLTRDGMQRVE